MRINIFKNIFSGLRVAEINGQVAIKDRSGIVNDFNRVNAGKEVMLLSLGAGGVGLNLIGGNHLFLLVRVVLFFKFRVINTFFLQ